MSKVPQELIDYILGYLYNNRKALAAPASTVARNWVAPCQFHLFYVLRIGRAVGGDFPLFLSASPEIAVNIRRLFIKGKIESETFPQILTHLPNLSALFLGDWFSLVTPAAAPFCRSFNLDYVFLMGGADAYPEPDSYENHLWRRFDGFPETDGDYEDEEPEENISGTHPRGTIMEEIGDHDEDDEDDGDKIDPSSDPKNGADEGVDFGWDDTSLILRR